MMSRPIEEIWNILNDLEDVLLGGFRTAHHAERAPRAANGAQPSAQQAAVGSARLVPGAGSAAPVPATGVANPAAQAAGSAAPVPATGVANPAVGSRIARDQPVQAAPGPHKEAGGNAVSDLLKALEQEVRNCTRCELGFGRTNAVPGMGPGNPDVFIIGEGPGAEEDRIGLPFVGPAGRYLDKWLAAIDLSRETNTFIGNIVKCRPPGNRDPHPEETSTCLPYLMRQIEILKPRAILTLGRIAAQTLLNTSSGIGATRGRVYQFHEIPLVATYHPSGVLRNPGYRREVWEDLKILKSLLNEAPANDA